MLSLEETKFYFTNEAGSCFIACPVRSLRNLYVFDPSLECILSEQGLCIRHAWQADHIVLVLGHCFGYRQHQFRVPVLLGTVLHLDDEL